MIETTHPEISIRRQCELIGLTRSAYYYQPASETDFNLKMMCLIDEQYMKTPYYGYPKMTAHLRGRIPGQSQANSAFDAKNGLDGDLSQAANDHFRTRKQGLPLSSARIVDYSTEPGLVYGYHLYPHAKRVHVSGSCDGLV